MMKRCELVFEAAAAARGGCKEHPYDTQSPGVCSSCLREKLSQLYNTNPIIDPRCFSPSSPASPHQSFSSSNRGFSGHRRSHFRRNASQAAESASCMLSLNLNLKKSKSLAFASRNRERDAVMMSGSRNKKDGFWTKVLKLKRKDHTRESIVMSSRA